jgi:hypothetical protein
MSGPTTLAAVHSLGDRRQEQLVDRLKLCMDALRALALQSNEANWYTFAENAVVQYLKSPGASLQKLREAVDHEADNSREHVGFWTAMQEYVSRPGHE